MQNATHYTSQDRKTKTAVITVHRKADNAKVGSITPAHRGYVADLGAGRKERWTTKSEAFNAIVEAI